MRPSAASVKIDKIPLGGHFSMKRLFLFATLLFLLVSATPAQTQHGMLLQWTAPSPVGGSGTISGYNVYRCLGSTCTPTVKINALEVTTLSYLDPAAGLVSGDTYTYAVTTVDSAGGESAFSPLASAIFTLITNPNRPPTLTVKSQ